VTVSLSVLFDGYKRHMLRDLDTGLPPPRGSRPPTCPRWRSPATSPLTWRPPGMHLAELHIDRAYAWHAP
jgi:hypothetical protein